MQTLHLPAGSLTVDTSSERLAQQPPQVLPPTPAPWEFSWLKWLAWFDVQNCTPHCQEHSVKSTDQANLWCKVYNFDDHHAVKQTWEGLPELTVASPWTAARVTSSSTSSIRETNMLSTSAACWTNPCSGTWKFGEDNEASPIFFKLKNLRKILISMHICQSLCLIGQEYSKDHKCRVPMNSWKAEAVTQVKHESWWIATNNSVPIEGVSGWRVCAWVRPFTDKHRTVADSSSVCTFRTFTKDSKRMSAPLLHDLE